MSLDRRAFVLEHTRLQRPPHVPEIRLHLATQIEPIWRQTEEELQQRGLDPPFWAFAWAGRLARMVEQVARQRLAAGPREGPEWRVQPPLLQLLLGLPPDRLDLGGQVQPDLGDVRRPLQARVLQHEGAPVQAHAGGLGAPANSSA